LLAKGAGGGNREGTGETCKGEPDGTVKFMSKSEDISLRPRGAGEKEATWRKATA
jgi:hypothetical protein